MASSSSPSIRVACVGDSITGTVPGTKYLHQFVKYSDLLQLVLETRLGVGKVEVLNCGRAGGKSTQTVADLHEFVLPRQPDIVTILIGGNDFGDASADRAQIAATLRSNLTTMVAALKQAGCKVLLLQYADPKAEDMSKIWTFLNEGNGVTAEVAQAEKVALLSLAPQFHEAEKTHSLAELVNPVDGVHTNPYGEIVYARAIYFKLVELGWI